MIREIKRMTLEEVEDALVVHYGDEVETVGDDTIELARCITFYELTDSVRRRVEEICLRDFGVVIEDEYTNKLVIDTSETFSIVRGLIEYRFNGWYVHFIDQDGSFVLEMDDDLIVDDWDRIIKPILNV